MGGDGYYPEYYLRKRKRDRFFSGLTQILVALVVMGGLGTLCGFLLFHYVWQPKHSAPGVNSKMADDRQDIGTEQKIAAAEQARQTQPPAPTDVNMKPVDLAAVPYSESAFPVTSVALQPHDGTAGEPGSTPAGASGPADSKSDTTSDTDQPGAGSGGTFEAPPPATAPSATPPLPLESHDTVKSSTTLGDTGDAEAKAVADKKAAEKKAADKKAADKKKADAAKAAADKQAAAEKNAKEDKTDKPKDEKSVAPTKVVYRVYGGSASSKDKAEALRLDLSKRGFSASIINQAGADSLLLVAVVDDLSKANALSDQLRKGGFSAFITKKTVK